MKIVKQVITLDYVEQEFRDVSESLNDLSLIRLLFVKDCHNDSYDFSIEIYGQGMPDEVGPNVEIAIDVDDLLTEDVLFQGIDKKKIPLLFSQNFRTELIQRNIRVEYNDNDETSEALNLAEPGEGFLLAMIR